MKAKQELADLLGKLCKAIESYEGLCPGCGHNLRKDAHSAHCWVKRALLQGRERQRTLEWHCIESLPDTKA